MHQLKGWFVRALLVSCPPFLGGCAASEVGPSDGDPSMAEGTDTTSQDLVAPFCRADSDCIQPLGPCRLCPDGDTTVCPRAECQSGRCRIVAPRCPGLTACGGIAGLPCPAGFTCVDDPRDDCSPCRGGADCGGICVETTCQCNPKLICTQVLTCVDGKLYPTGCGPRNCDRPIGDCSDTKQ
ncbi:MAG: hypothetical protein QM784_10780 [Polyangiaceae bacterium]